MIRYVLAATALRIFSLNGTTRALYRRVGNIVGSKRRAASLDIAAYISRGDLLVDLVRKHSVTRDGQRLLEIGTGWMHWFALYLRLFFQVEIAMLDVWDNRQFEALRSAFARLESILMEKGVPLQVRANLQILLSATSFADLYRRLQLSYVIDPDGSLERFADASLGCVFSFHVLEHVPRVNFIRLCAEMYRVLEPGGFSIHQIGIDDHLSHYDPSCSPKQYLAFSDRQWKLFFENGVQYINRLQMSDCLRAFDAAGFVLREKLMETADLTGLRIDPLYRGYDADDLACTILTVVLQKPATSA